MSKTGINRRRIGRVHNNGIGRIAGIKPPSETEGNGSAPEPVTAPAPEPAPPPNADGRSPGGKFGPGNKFGCGNPFARKMGAMRSAFLNAVTEADVMTVAQGLLKLAVGGDVDAARLFLSYALGKPAAVVEPDELDRGEFSLLFHNPGHMADLGTMIRFLTAPHTVEGVREEIMEAIYKKQGRYPDGSKIGDEDDEDDGFECECEHCGTLSDVTEEQTTLECKKCGKVTTMIDDDEVSEKSEEEFADEEES